MKAGGEGLVGVPKITGETKIGDLEDALGGEQEVVGFEIAVVVGGGEGGREEGVGDRGVSKAGRS